MKNKTRQPFLWMGGIAAIVAIAIVGLTVTEAAAAGNVFNSILCVRPR